MKKRRPLSFLFFSNDLKMWYFKYVIGAILLSIVTTGTAIFLLTGEYTRTITVMGINLPGTATSPVNIARDMLLSFRTQIAYILMLETIILILIGIVASLYFGYKIMGPVARLEKEIDEMALGAQIHPLSLRKGDYLYPVVLLMNKLLEVVGKKQETIDEFKNTLKGVSSYLKDMDKQK